MVLVSKLSVRRQQQKQQEEEERAATVPSGQSTGHQQEPPGSFMDMDYDYESSESENGHHRPQSRASQHTTDNSNGHVNPGMSNPIHRQQQQQQQQPAPTQQQLQQQQQRQNYGPPSQGPYAYQESQFDEPTRDADDDMW